MQGRFGIARTRLRRVEAAAIAGGWVEVPGAKGVFLAKIVVVIALKPNLPTPCLLDQLWRKAGGIGRGIPARAGDRARVEGARSGGGRSFVEVDCREASRADRFSGAVILSILPVCSFAPGSRSNRR